MSTLFYGSQVNITANGYPLSGHQSSGCDIWHHSASTPIVIDDIPDVFIIYDASGEIPKDASGTALPVSYGDVVTIYNATSQMFWKNIHAECLLDGAGGPGTNFVLMGAGYSGPIMVSHWSDSSPTTKTNYLTITQDSESSENQGKSLTVHGSANVSGKVGSYLLVASSNSDIPAGIEFWSISVGLREVDFTIGSVRNKRHTRNSLDNWIVPIMLGTALIWVLCNTNQRRKK